MEKKKLILKKEVIANLSNDKMRGGYYEEHKTTLKTLKITCYCSDNSHCVPYSVDVCPETDKCVFASAYCIETDPCVVQTANCTIIFETDGCIV